MSSELDQKLVANGENVLRLIRVTESGGKNRFISNILISFRRFREGALEMFSVRILPLSIASRTAAMNDKLSLNKFEARINHTEHSIAMGPSTGVQIEEHLQNYGIGTYAFNVLLTELRRSVPTYTFQPFEIVLGEEYTSAMKERLVAFLSKFGVSLSFTDTEQRSGVMRANTPMDLIPHYNADKITEMDLEAFIFQLLSERGRNEQEIANMRTEIDRMGEESFAGIPKKQLVKYTLIACVVTLLIIFTLVR